MVATFITMYKRTKLHEVWKKKNEKWKVKKNKKEKEKTSEFACNKYKRN